MGSMGAASCGRELQARTHNNFRAEFSIQKDLETRHATTPSSPPSSSGFETGSSMHCRHDAPRRLGRDGQSQHSACATARAAMPHFLAVPRLGYPPPSSHHLLSPSTFLFLHMITTTTSLSACIGPCRTGTALYSSFTSPYLSCFSGSAFSCHASSRAAVTCVYEYLYPPVPSTS